MNPIVSILTQAIIPMVTSRATRESGKTLEKADISKIEREVAAAIEGNSELKNLTNQEAPWQSRVAVGSVIGSLGIIVPMAGRLLGYDIAEDEVVRILGAFWALAGFLYTLYGRFGQFAAPLFEKRRIVT